VGNWFFQNLQEKQFSPSRKNNSKKIVHMKKYLILSLLLSGSAIIAQSPDLSKDKKVESFRKESDAKVGKEVADSSFWKTGGNFGLQFSQAAYSNWQAGGVNSIAGNSVIGAFANYQSDAKWIWNNRVLLAYGLNYQDTIFNKTDDRIELETRLDYLKNAKWNYSAFLNFRTQFMPGFAKPGESGDELRISDFMAPGYMLVGLGATYKPNKRFTAFLSPATSKSTFVTVERLSNAGAYGVDSGQTARVEIGGYLNLAYTRKVLKGVDMQARVDMFSNYLEDPSLIDINSELIFNFTVNKNIKANLALAYIYDHDVKFDLDENPETVAVPRSQFRQVLSIGFTYSFGDKPE
jgi:hypothetical protein